MIQINCIIYVPSNVKTMDATERWLFRVDETLKHCGNIKYKYIFKSEINKPITKCDHASWQENIQKFILDKWQLH